MKSLVSSGGLLAFLMILLVTSSQSVMAVERWPHHPDAKYGGNAIMTQYVNPQTLNPIIQMDLGAAFVYQNIGSSLVNMDEGSFAGKPPYGNLAKSWDVTEEGKVYTFHLFENIKWHDGKPFTSADVKYTYEEIINQKYMAYGYFLRFVNKIETPDTDTVRFVLQAPNGAFIAQMAMASNWYAQILPRHLYEGTAWKTNPYNDKPVGTGPYKFKEWMKGSHVTLVRNEEWFRGRPYLDSLTIRFITDRVAAYNAFSAGEIHELIQNLLPAYPELPNLNKTKGIRLSKTMSCYDRCVYFNMKKAPLGTNQKLREAINYAIDRDEINQLGFFGFQTAATHPCPPYFVDYFDKSLRYPGPDLKKAEQLLDEAGFPKKADGWRLEVSLLHSSALLGDATTAELIEAQLKKVGIKVNRDPLDTVAWLAKIRDLKHDMTIYWVNYAIDPASYGDHFRTNSTRNFMGYSNPRVDEAIDKGVQLFDPQKRALYYKEVQKILFEEKPWLPIGWEYWYNAAYNEWRGFHWEPDGFGASFGWWGFGALWWDKGQPPVKTATTTSPTTKATTDVSAISPEVIGGAVGLVAVVAILAYYVTTKRKKAP